MSVPRSAVTGMISAGRKSLLPSFADQASRSVSLVVGGWLRPMKPKPASPARPSTRRPLPKSPIASPPSRLSAIRPQKAALPNRFGFLPSSALKKAKAANIAPASA